MMKVATVASIIVVLTLCLVVSVSALGLRKVGQFKVSHPSFMHILPVTGPESKDLVISSFTGNPFGSGKLYIEADISSSYKNTSTINPTMIKGTDTFKWPNDFKMAPKGVFPSSDSALVQADGFLVPGKSNGGIYIVEYTKGEFAKPFVLTTLKKGYFYHQVEWFDVNQDGRLDIITCRGTKGFIGSGSGELLWLEQPADEADRYKPWPEHVVTDGPDVAFNVRAGKKSKTVEVFASEFFSSQFTVVVIDLPSGEMVGKRIIDDTIGAAYMVKLADLNGDGEDELLVTNHAPKADSSGIWAYEMPVSEDMLNGTFTKHELARGFPVRERGFNQAAPGFAYVVYPHVKYDAEPVILIAGDGSTSAYELVWRKDWTYDVKEIEILGGTVGSLTYDDIDADGYTEVFIPNYDKGYVEIWTYAPIRSM